MVKIGIVGCGPRGLASLEAFLSTLEQQKSNIDYKLFIFEIAKYYGAGQVWDPTQSDSNWINISLRGLSELKGRKAINLNGIFINEFPKFTSWLEKNYNIINNIEEDKYPLRSIMGEYLYQRFKSLSDVLLHNEKLEIINSKVISLDRHKELICLKTESNNTYNVDECLLTIGHQKTKLDDQMKDWVENYNDLKLSLFTHPYDNSIKDSVSPQSNVAIRGLGLSTIDIIRTITEELGGQFQKIEGTHSYVFKDSLQCPFKIIPFSLDGLICAPKPLNSIIDSEFEPTEIEVKQFCSQLRSKLSKSSSITSNHFLADQFALTFAEKFNSTFKIPLDELKDIVISWLLDSNTKHDLILNTNNELLAYMKALAEMAIGERKASLDYTMGQFWRWLQPEMYKFFSHSKLSDKVMGEIIDLDERTKRYSYGPPVKSIYQLIALAEHGILDLSLANNPDISLSNNGWKLNDEDHSVICDVMINSVLSAPSVQNINTEPIHSFIRSYDVEVVSSDLGVSTSKDGMIESKTIPYTKISLLGRIAKGSVLGVDAILECFGPRIDDWAKGIVERNFLE